jgi:hypothetical protein
MQSGHVEVLSNYTAGTEKKARKPSVKIASVLTENQTKHFPNKSLERYRYINLFSSLLLVTLFHVLLFTSQIFIISFSLHHFIARSLSLLKIDDSALSVCKSVGHRLS